jgi:uncharacterized protein with PIN domain
MFIDTSAIVALIVGEPEAEARHQGVGAAQGVAVH